MLCNTGARYYMEVVGVRVFRVKDSWMTDEYLTCKVEWVDLNEPVGVNHQHTLTLSHELEALVEAWQTMVSLFMSNIYNYIAIDVPLNAIHLPHAYAD